MSGDSQLTPSARSQEVPGRSVTATSVLTSQPPPATQYTARAPRHADPGDSYTRGFGATVPGEAAMHHRHTELGSKQTRQAGKRRSLSADRAPRENTRAAVVPPKAGTPRVRPMAQTGHDRHPHPHAASHAMPSFLPSLRTMADRQTWTSEGGKARRRTLLPSWPGTNSLSTSGRRQNCDSPTL